jgi:alpha-L-fucosidase 2
MVSQHDPGDILNLDISGGLPAVIMNMLVQSFEPKSPGSPWRISILPCLPDEWPDGSLEGVRCRGGFEVSIHWSGGVLKRVEIVSLRGEPCEVEYGERVEEAVFDDGGYSESILSTTKGTSGGTASASMSASET